MYRKYSMAKVTSPQTSSARGYGKTSSSYKR